MKLQAGILKKAVSVFLVYFKKICKKFDTGEILAVAPQARGKKPHISPSTAGVNAVNQAAEV